MTDDIVARLRAWFADESTWGLLTEAADEIERLRAALRQIEQEHHVFQRAHQIAYAALEGEASDDAAT